MKKVLLLAILQIPLAGGFLAAQTTVVGVPSGGPAFFAAIVGGIVLALGFQLIFTHLAAAAGLSALHMPLKKAEENIEGTEHRAHEAKEKKGKKEEKSVHEKARGVSSAYGIWTLVTTSIAVFFASWLAVRLSGTVSVFYGIIVGLVVWGLLYMFNFLLQMRAVSSMTGSLMNIVSTSAKSLTEAAGSIFGKSEEKKAGDTAAEIAASVRDEIFHGVDLRKEINRYIDQLKPDYSEMRKQFERALSDARVETTTRYEAPSEERTTAQVSVGGPNMQQTGDTLKAAASKVQDVKGKVQQEMQTDKDMPSKVTDTAMEAAGLSREQAEQYRHKVEDYLRNTGKDELNPEGIKRDLEQLFQDPKGGFEAIKQRAGQFDKETVASLLAQRQDMNQDEAKKVVDWIEGTLDTIKGKFQDVTGAVSDKARQAQGTPSGIEGKVQDYLDSLNRPELKYQDIKGDFELLLHDPKAGADALISRLKSVDRDTLKAILASRKDVSEDDAEHMVSQIEQARDSLIEKAQKMKDEVASRVKQAEEEAIHQADEVRKTVATATWWIFATAIVSGIVAAVGGFVGTIV